MGSGMDVQGCSWGWPPRFSRRLCCFWSSFCAMQVVLVGAGGSLYEGLSSNFFAVIDGAVHTAGQGVLAGTVRRLALEVAARLRVPGAICQRRRRRC